MINLLKQLNKLLLTGSVVSALIIIPAGYGVPKNEVPDRPARKQNTIPTIQIKDSVVPARASAPVLPVTTSNRAKASWYGVEACAGKSICRTASGATFVESNHTTACANRFRLGTTFRFRYQGKEVTAICNDRGGFEKLGRTFDLSKGTFLALAPTSRGVIEVEWEEIKP